MLPVSSSRPFSTVQDSQSAVRVVLHPNLRRVINPLDDVGIGQSDQDPVMPYDATRLREKLWHLLHLRARGLNIH